MTKLFFGYDSEPALSRDTLRRAASSITATGSAESTTWEDIAIGGRVIINRVLEEIDSCDVAILDMSTLNDNVLFEAGYAIARGKIVWPLLDATDPNAEARWKQFHILSSLGHVRWSNSEEIKTAFLREQPHLRESSLYDDEIDPNLTQPVGSAIFYAPAFHDTDASRKISRRLNREVERGVQLFSSDPTESSLNPLVWYAQKVYETDCTIVHLAALRRNKAWLHNSRLSLVAGIAVGLERRVLLLAEDEYESPFDYQDYVQVYTNERQAGEILDRWLLDLDLPADSKRRPQRRLLATELRNLRFGEHVAENEGHALSEYFIETAAFDEVLRSRTTLFVGRKGTGKTANMIQAAAQLSQDARNLVVVIKPASYEFQSLLSLLTRLPQDVKEYTLRSLWSFLLQSEIARAAVQVLESRPISVPLTEAERQLVEFVDSSSFGLREEFAVRFEQTVRAIAESGLANAPTIAAGRDMLNETFHDTAIKRLRSLIGPVLTGRNRVAILIDNLDKAWEKTSDLNLLSQLLLGLLATVGQVSIDYEREDFWRNRVRLSLATFLRSDIYAHLQRVAREPDKIPVSTLEWNDPQLLIRVVEERFLAVRSPGAHAEDLWRDFFCKSVKGHETRDYILSRVLPRPRDVVFFCNSAIQSAVNRRHDRVEPDDILTAERNYSQFAFEALLVVTESLCKNLRTCCTNSLARIRCFLSLK